MASDFTGSHCRPLRLIQNNPWYDQKSHKIDTNTWYSRKLICRQYYFTGPKLACALNRNLQLQMLLTKYFAVLSTHLIIIRFWWKSVTWHLADFQTSNGTCRCCRGIFHNYNWIRTTCKFILSGFSEGNAIKPYAFKLRQNFIICVHILFFYDIRYTMWHQRARLIKRGNLHCVMILFIWMCCLFDTHDTEWPTIPIGLHTIQTEYKAVYNGNNCIGHLSHAICSPQGTTSHDDVMTWEQAGSKPISPMPLLSIFDRKIKHIFKNKHSKTSQIFGHFVQALCVDISNPFTFIECLSFIHSVQNITRLYQNN